MTSTNPTMEYLVNNSTRDELAKPAAAPAGGALSVIDKVWEFTWATRIICIVLCFDIALVQCPGGGLLGWAAGRQPTLSLGWYCAALTIFCMLVMYAIPIVLACWKSIAHQINAYLPGPERINHGHGMVPAYKLHDRALREQNRFPLDLYEQHQRLRADRKAKANGLADLLAMLVAFLSANLAVGWWFDESPRLMYAFVARPGEPGWLVVIFVLSLFRLPGNEHLAEGMARYHLLPAPGRRVGATAQARTGRTSRVRKKSHVETNEGAALPAGLLACCQVPQF